MMQNKNTINKHALITNKIAITRKYSKNSEFTKCFLSPWWITGMADGEGNFSLNINEKSKKIAASFKVTQKSHSKSVLLLIQKYFSCGKVVIDNKDKEAHKFVVSNVEDLLLKIIPHFDKYNLVSSKHLDYLDWKKAIALFKDKSRLKNKDLIVSIKEGMNRGRTFEKRWSRFNGIPHIEASWLQAFIDCEGSFQFLISDTFNRNKPYLAVQPTLEIAQNSHDIMLLEAIKQFFGIGYLKPKFDTYSLEKAKSCRSLSRFIITNSSLIIEFVDKYPMLTRKHLDYLDWKELVSLKNNKAHHTGQGRLKMLKIKKGMNANRSSLIGDVKYFSTAVTMLSNTANKENTLTLSLNPLKMWIIFILGTMLWVIFVSAVIFALPILGLSILYPDLFLSSTNELVIPAIEIIDKVDKEVAEKTVGRGKGANWADNFTSYLQHLDMESKIWMPNPLDYDESIQINDPTLYDGFVKALPSAPTASTPTPFSPFTPNTFQDLKDEIAMNKDNLQKLDTIYETSQEVVRNSVKDQLIEEQKYLLKQQTNHINALMDRASKVELKDVDSDKLLVEMKELQDNVVKLSKHFDYVKSRKLS